MVNFTGKLVVPYPRQRVWDLMSNWANVVHWDSNLTSSIRTPDQPKPDRVGTKYSCIFDLNGTKSDVDYTVIAFEDKKLAQFEGFTNRLRSCDTLAFADASDALNSTQITANFDISLRGILRPLSFLMNGAMQSTCAAVMTKMEKYIHAELSTNSNGPRAQDSGTPVPVTG
jgi:hypothetical protein